MDGTAIGGSGFQDRPAQVFTIQPDLQVKLAAPIERIVRSAYECQPIHVWLRRAQREFYPAPPLERIDGLANGLPVSQCRHNVTAGDLENGLDPLSVGG